MRNIFMSVGITLLTACTLNVPAGTDPAVFQSAFGFMGTVVTIVVGPIVTAICAWILKQKFDKKTDATAKVLSDKTEESAQRLIEKVDQHKDEIVKRTDAASATAQLAYTEANDANAKLNRNTELIAGVCQRLEASEKRNGRKPQK